VETVPQNLSLHPFESARPHSPHAEGSGFAVVVNSNAKRGGRRVAVQIARVLPGASVKLTKTTQEIEAWLRGLHGIECTLAAGGDGSAIALVNAFDRMTPAHVPIPPIGVLPLGTGNAWARSTGARKLDPSLHLLEFPARPLPFRRFGVIECEGTLTHFAGSGWDAQILDDFRKQVAASPSKRVAKSVYGYVAAMLMRTAPKTLFHGRPHVLIENLGDEVYTITADRKLLRLAGVGRGSVLYDGLASVAGVSTCPEFGFGFRAYPFAERFVGLMNVRVYDRHAIPAIGNIAQLWRGSHPIAGMHDWFASDVRMTFSRPMPLQIGGDAVGSRRTIEYRASPREVRLLDWRALR
jgi:diacylglycerol kinase family enzyme